MAGLKVFDGSSWRAVGLEDSQWDVLTATTNPTSVSLSWPTAGGSPTSYEIDIDGTVIDVGNVTSYEKTSLTPNQQYRFKVRPKYSDGSTGGWTFFKDRTPLGFNAATGGTTTDVSNYNGTGQTWRVHTFNSNGTFTVTNSADSFRILYVGGGGGGQSVGGGGSSGINGNGGSGGDVTATLSVGSYTATIGAGGAGNGSGGGRCVNGAGLPGGTTTFHSYTGSGGAAGGCGGSGSGPGPTSNITGTSIKYGGFANGQRGAGGAGGTNGNGSSGGTSGTVIISYRIA